MINILRGAVFDENKIEENLNLTKGACLSEKVMVELVKRGIGRQKAHEMLRKAAIKSRAKNRFIKDIILENDEIKAKFTEQEISELLDPHKYIGLAVLQVENLINYLKKKYNL